MMKIQRWLLHRQKEFHYLLLILSAVMLLCSFGLTLGDPDLYRLVLQLLAMLLSAACFYYLRAWYLFTRYEHICRRICYEYLRVIHKQPYKVDRLSQTEFEILAFLLNDYSIEEISLRMHCTLESLYVHIGRLKEKLEVSSKEGLLDMDFSAAF